MKKFTGRYTTNTAKALKGSERILCQVSEDGTIYICNGFLLCTMNAPEYAANEIDELKAKLAELHETKTEQPAEQKPEPKTAAEIIAARWAEVDGLTATIKGATTAAPVVWLAGDTKPHEKEIEAAGGKWSGKKNAYYFRVA